MFNVKSNSNHSVILRTVDSIGLFSSPLARDITLVMVFNLVLIATAQLAIPLPFTPTPITGQTFGVLITALALGGSRAVTVIAFYLAEGAAGLPVFAGGSGGAHVLIGPTAGYLFGFLPSAALVGWLAERGWDRSYIRSFSALAIGTAVIFVCGLIGMSSFVKGHALLAAGLWPFLPGAGIKIIAAFWLSPTLAHLRPTK